MPKYYEILQGRELYVFKDKECLNPRSFVIELNTLDAEIQLLKSENKKIAELLEKTKLEKKTFQNMLKNISDFIHQKRDDENYTEDFEHILEICSQKE